MMKKKIITALLIIFFSSAFTTAGTFAVFSTHSTNKGNKLSAGTVVLNVDTDPQKIGIQADSIFNFPDIKPGFSSTKNIVVKNPP